MCLMASKGESECMRPSPPPASMSRLGWGCCLPAGAQVQALGASTGVGGPEGQTPLAGASAGALGLLTPMAA